MRLLHLVQGHVDAVQQRRAALGLGEGQPVLNLFQVRGEGHHQLRPVVELNQEEFVLGIGGLEELRHRLARFVQLAAHAAAGIEDEPDRKRRVFARELRDLLLALVFEHAEVFLLQARDEAVQRIGHRHRNQHQRGVDADVAAPDVVRAARRLAWRAG